MKRKSIADLELDLACCEAAWKDLKKEYGAECIIKKLAHHIAKIKNKIKKLKSKK